MGFLAPKPPAPPPIPDPPELPPVIKQNLDQTQKNKIRELMKVKKKGYTETILTGNQGDTSEAEIQKKTLLGG